VSRSGDRWNCAFSRLRPGAAGLVPGLTLTLLLSASPTRASDGEAKPADEVAEPRRELAGHNFIPSRFADDPFVSTFVASETGAGHGSAPGREYDLNGKPLGMSTYEVSAFAQYLDYQYGFLDCWAMRLSLRAVAYSGTNATGFAGVGATLAVSPTLGTTVSFKVGDRLRLGGRLELGFGPAVFLNLVESVVDSIGAGHITAPVNSFSQFTVNPLFVGAWAIHRSLGMTFSLGYQHTHASNDNYSTGRDLVQGHVLLDFDMKELKWAPIGLVAGFGTQFSLAEPKFLAFRYNFGIFYTAIRPFNVGLEVLFNRAPVIGNTQIFLSSVIGLLELQYNFN
jgi:hypothetical protein